MNIKIFNNPTLQEIFIRQGFVVLNLLNKKEIEQLNNSFERLNSNLGLEGMVIGSILNKKEYKKQVEIEINNVINNKIENLFIDYEIFNSSFVYKTPKTLYEFPPHQDHSMVDENKFISANIWIPLVDIHLTNGPLFIIPGTQFSNLPSYRGSNINYLYMNQSKSIYKYATPVFIKKGQAIILNHSIIHYSIPNLTNQVRKAIVVAIKPKQATSLLYYFNKLINKIQVYHVDNNLKFSYEKFHYDKNEQPQGNIIKEFDYTNKTFDKLTLESTLQQLVKKSHFLNNKSIVIYKAKNLIRYYWIEFLKSIIKFISKIQ